MTNQVPELKPCPFCGGEATANLSSAGWSYSCLSMGHGEVSTCIHKTAKEAAEAWNTRADHAPKVKPLKRGSQEDRQLGWTLDADLLSDLRKEAGDWGPEYLESVEAIALAVERRILSALEGGEA